MCFFSCPLMRLNLGVTHLSYEDVFQCERTCEVEMTNVTYNFQYGVIYQWTNSRRTG